VEANGEAMNQIQKSSKTLGKLIPYLFVGAAFVYLTVFMAFPIAKGIWTSFTDTTLLNPRQGQFVGLENYATAIHGGLFIKSMVTTLVYSFFSVLGCLVLGIISALLINKHLPFLGLFRSILVLPWAVPTVALALVFRWIINDTNGIANRMTKALGIGQVGWLTNPNYGMVSVVVPTIWKLSPFVMLVVLAALQSIPEELYEAGRIDGADSLTIFRSIVWPFILPTIRVVTLLMTIWSFRRFEIIWLISGGGPVNATTTIVIDVYRQAFSNNSLGLASAVGVLGLFLSLAVTALYYLTEKKNEEAV
jgi:multiple sugar transport system permease protein